jgi:hypothetical protein
VPRCAHANNLPALTRGRENRLLAFEHAVAGPIVGR